MHPTSAVHAAASRRLAANLLEAQLLRLARAGVVVERRLDPGLLALSAHRLYRRLGFVRLGDYLTERLGMSLRRCQSIVRLERALRDLPAVAAAFDAGALPPSKVRLVASAATPETQDLWLARAQRLTVRDLESASRAARQAERPDETDTASSEAGREETGPTAPDAATDTAPEAGSATVPLATNEDEPGVLISFAAPGRAFALWQWALEFVRRVAGRQEPAWRCAEYLAAEFLSGWPDAKAPEHPCAHPGDLAGDADPSALLGSAAPGNPARPAGPAAPGNPARSSEPAGEGADFCAAEGAARDAGEGSAFHPVHEGRLPSPASGPPRLPPRCAISDEEVWSRAVASVREAIRPLGPAADLESILSGPPPNAPDAPEPDPWDLDGLLRGLVRLRQSLAWRQGRLLAAVSHLDLYRDLGFDSLGDWCRSVLGMSPRRARYLVSLVGEVRTSPDGAPLPPSEPPPTGHTFALPDGTSRAPGDGAPQTGNAAPQAAARHTFAPRDAAGGRADAQPGWHMFAPDPCTHRIGFWAPLDVAAVWRSALRSCRRAHGPHLRDWRCLLIFIIEMRDAWQPDENAEWRRRYRILDRDGWRCLAPGCTSRSHLNAHHIVFRSHRGSDDASNLVTLCVGHHQAGVNDNLIRCHGRAPDAIWWEFGIRPDGPPLVRYFGERTVGAAAPAGGSWTRQCAPAADARQDGSRANGDGTAGRPAVKAPGPG